jgi:hypothetical protein
MVTGYTATYTDPTGVTKAITLPDPIATAVSVTGLIPGTYTFTVTAKDAAGNTTSSHANATTPILTDDFESGTLAAPWASPATGNLTVQNTTTHAGAYAVQEQSTGSPSWIIARLASTYPAVHASAWVYINSRSTSASFLKLRGAKGEYIAYLYVNANGYLSVRNDAGNVTHTSSTPLAAKQWYHVELYLDVNPGGTITIKAAVNGTPVKFTTAVAATETLGTKPVGQVTLGDDVSGRTYDIAIDDLTLDITAPTW